MIVEARLKYDKNSYSEIVTLGTKGLESPEVLSIDFTDQILTITMAGVGEDKQKRVRRIINTNKLESLVLTDTNELKEPIMEDSTKKNAYVISKRMKFDYGHRVMNHESKCITPHGHQGIVIAFARAEQLDDLGRVIDFSELKKRLGSWLDLHWDHAFVCNKEDTTLIAALETVKDSSKPIYLLNGNPTAENMAMHLLHEIAPVVMSGTNIEIFKIQFWETETSMAEVEL